VADIVLDETTEVVIRDSVDHTRELAVNSDGSINVVTGGVSGIAVEHLNGSVGTGGATLTFAAQSVSILVHNVSGGINLLVSFDGGTNFKTVNAGAVLAIDVKLSSIRVKSSAGTANYEILVVE